MGAASETTDLRSRVASRRLLVLAYVLVLVFVILGEHPGLRTWGFSRPQRDWYELGFSLCSAIPLLVGVLGVGSKAARDWGGIGRRWALGLAGVLGFWSLRRTGFEFAQMIHVIAHGGGEFWGCFTAPVLPPIAYAGLGWLALVVRVQSEGCELIADRRRGVGMWLRSRWFHVMYGLALSLGLALGLDRLVESRMDETLPLVLAPVSSLLAFELCMRLSRTPCPSFAAITGATASDQAPADLGGAAKPLLDPIALKRGHLALLQARVFAGLVVALVLLALGVLIYTDPTPRGELVVLSLALIVPALGLALKLAPRPRPDARRQVASTHGGLSPRSLALLERVEILRARLERYPDRDLWAPAVNIEILLEQLDARERERLDARGANREVLRRATQVIAGFGSLSNPRRRAIYADLIGFLASAHGRHGLRVDVDPYRAGPESVAGFTREWMRLDEQDAAITRPYPWVVGVGVLAWAMVVGFVHGGTGLLITAPWLAVLLYLLAMAWARRMFTLALPALPPAPTPHYSPAFERERATVASAWRRRWATVVSVGLCAAAPSVLVGVLAGQATIDFPALFVTSSSIAAAALLLPLARRRLLERPAASGVAKVLAGGEVPASEVRRIELVALRLRWAEQAFADPDLLARIIALLSTASDLGGLDLGDRKILLARLGDAIDRGAALPPAHRRALELELETAERLLAAADARY